MDAAHDETEKQLARMERKLKSIYTRAGSGLKVNWRKYLEEISPAIEEAQKAYDEAMKSGNAEEISKAEKRLTAVKRDKIMMDSRYRRMIDQTAAELSQVNETALAYINGEIPKVYIQNFIAVESGIEEAVAGYSFELVDQNTVKRLIVDGEKSLLPAASQKTLNKIEKTLARGKDTRWNTRKINAEILQGILQGESMQKISGRLQKVAGMNASSAIRNARTMVTGAENAGRMDMLHKATSDGIQVERTWIATIDGRTRHSHAVLDGETKPIDTEFSNGLMYPGDVNGDPSEIYNCRCTLGYKVIGFAKI